MKIACTLIQKYINKNHKIITFDFNGKKQLFNYQISFI